MKVNEVLFLLNKKTGLELLFLIILNMIKIQHQEATFLSCIHLIIEPKNPNGRIAANRGMQKTRS